MPASARQWSKGIVPFRYERLDVTNCLEKRRLTAAICSKQQLLSFRSVLKVHEAPEIVDVDPSQHGYILYGQPGTESILRVEALPASRKNYLATLVHATLVHFWHNYSCTHPAQNFKHNLR